MPDLHHLDEDAPDGLRRLKEASSGEINLGFSELTEARFPVVGDGWQLFIDDAPLPVVTVEGRRIWTWRPGFYAGTVRAELTRESTMRGIEFLLDVSPDPGKVGQRQFRAMVEDIWSFDPALMIGDQAATTVIGAAGDREDPGVRYMRIARYGEALVSSLNAIRRDPHKTLRTTRGHVPLHAVRRADVQTILAASRSVAALAFCDGDDQDSPTSVDGECVRFSVPMSIETFDSAANRTMAALVDLLRQAISRLSGQLAAQIANASDMSVKQALMDRLPRRQRVLEELHATLTKVLRREPFASVTRREVTAAGLTAVAAHPLYARSQQLLWMMLRPGYEGDQLDEQSAMSPTWAIFEAWCFVKIASAMRARYPEWKWTQKSPSDGRHMVVGVLGENRIDLYLQQPFSHREEPPEHGLWSVSSHLIPDIVLVVRGRSRSSWMVLDPKYRRGRQNVLDAMRSAHIYRDALRRFTEPPAKSLLLIPAPADDAAWLHAPEFRETHGVGVLVFSSKGIELDPITSEIDAALLGSPGR